MDPEALAVEPRTREDSLRQAAMRRADSAALRVDTIVATPARLRLVVGDSARFFDLVRLEPRDAAGSVVPGFTPLFRAMPPALARLRHGYLVAVAPGAAVLVIQPMRFAPAGREAPAVPVTRVPIEIVPR